jgi:hypothetical protein
MPVAATGVGAYTLKGQGPHIPLTQTADGSDAYADYVYDNMTSLERRSMSRHDYKLARHSVYRTIKTTDRQLLRVYDTGSTGAPDPFGTALPDPRLGMYIHCQSCSAALVGVGDARVDMPHTKLARLTVASGNPTLAGTALYVPSPASWDFKAVLATCMCGQVVGFTTHDVDGVQVVDEPGHTSPSVIHGPAPGGATVLKNVYIWAPATANVRRH